MKIVKSRTRTVKNRAHNVEHRFRIDTDRTLSQKIIKNRRTSVKNRRKPVQNHLKRRKTRKKSHTVAHNRIKPYKIA